MQFLYSAKFMQNSLSSFANNLAEGIHKIKCKNKHNKKKREMCGIEYKDWNCFLEYKNFENLKEYKCLSCNKNYQNKFNENLKRQFFNTCK